ncbi:endonuclease/exonuclease/phosphatase family protein [Glaciecola sp. SC05]|uniref:endonuclease/exonuclease/phosphatase family protein n=1 Tax=Glaciecola sp. SC05 TaxID=1987355 RepID=UPI00352711C1
MATDSIQENSAIALSACGQGNVKSVDEQGFDCANNMQTGSAMHKNGWVMPVGYEFPDGDTVKIISWNVEHFVDEHDDPYVENRREDNPEHMGNKRADLVAALRMADADVVVLQEFESAKLLRHIAVNELADMGYQFFADAPSHTWYMNVVVMSRVPLGVLYSYGNLHTPLVDWLNDEGKPASQNRLNTRTWAIDVYPSTDYSFVMGAVHLKAGRDKRDVAMRLGQINMLKGQFERFLNEDPDRNILLVGDFNSLPNTIELNTLLSGQHNGNTFTDPLSDTDFTHTALEPQRRLDYAVMNGNMLPELVPGSAKPVSYFEPKRQDDLADHLPVVIEFYTTDRTFSAPLDYDTN